MSIFDFFRRKEKSNGVEVDSYYRLVTPYETHFRSWNGALYESDLIRSAIDAIARHASKLRVEINTSKQSRLLTYLKHQPNDWETWSQFLYRLATILNLHNTAFIVPLFDINQQICGYYPILPTSAEVVWGDDIVVIGDRYIINSTAQIPWLKYRLRSGSTEAVPLKMCAVLTRFQYKSDFFGETNDALKSTMNLVTLQNQAIQTAVKNSAAYRFLAQVNNFAKPEDLAKERKRFSEENLSADSDAGGLLLFPNTYTNIKQIESNSYTVDAETMKLIQTSVSNYFGVSEKVLQNAAFGDAWSAFYEGCIEPFAIQFSETMTKLLFTDIERTNGSQVLATSNRLQYLSNTEKLSVSTRLVDRGIFTRNEVRDIWNLGPIPGGDVPVIRGEYHVDADEEAVEQREEEVL